MTLHWKLEYCPNKRIVGIHLSEQIPDSVYDSTTPEFLEFSSLIRNTHGVDGFSHSRKYALYVEPAQCISREITVQNVIEACCAWFYSKGITFDTIQRGDNIDHASIHTPKGLHV